MKNENKIKNLHQFLSFKNSASSKKVSLNIKSETTSPSSYNERNYSAQNKPLEGKKYNKNNKLSQYLGFKKSNSIDKNCYKNIRLLDNLKDKNINIYDSLSKDLNKNNINNITKINVTTLEKDKYISIYNKSIYIQIMKYYTSSSKNKIIKNEEVDFILKPISRLMTNQKKNIINLKNMKNNLDLKNNSKIGKKDINQKNELIFKNKDDKNNNNNKKLYNNMKEINSNSNKNYIGIDDNFNLTFGKSTNWIEMSTTDNNINNNLYDNKNIKSKNNKTTNKNKTNNFIFNIKNIKNNINIIKNKKVINNIIIGVNPRSQRNNSHILAPNNEINNRNLINDNIKKEENTPSFLNENENNKEDDKINSKKSFQIKSKKINLPKNIINIENIKMNHHIFQNLFHHKQKLLKEKKNKLEAEHKKNDEKEYYSSRSKILDKKFNLMEQIKHNMNDNINFDYFNKDSSIKKKL